MLRKDKDYMKEYYQKNKERIIGHNKKYRQKNKERDKERVKEYGKKYRQENKEHIKEWHQENKERLKEYKYKKLYNLSLEEIDQLLIAQDHKCPICGKSLIETRRGIDHNHKTGKIRGILCDRCNFGLGQFDDNPEFLRKAIIYIETK